MKDKKDKRWCSKHQVVHNGEIKKGHWTTTATNYWSCRYPNDPKRDKEQKDWQNDPRSTDEYYG